MKVFFLKSDVSSHWQSYTVDGEIFPWNGSMEKFIHEMHVMELSMLIFKKIGYLLVIIAWIWKKNIIKMLRMGNMTKLPEI